MKRKLQFALVALGGLIYGQTVSAQVTYDFDTDLTGVTAQSGLPAVGSLPLPSPTTTVAIYDNGGVQNTTKVLRQQTSPATTNVNDLTLIGNDTDYSITWKQYITALPASASWYKTGFLLRGTGSGSYATGIKTGYFAYLQYNASGSVTFFARTSTGTGLGASSSSSAVYLDGGTTAMTLNKAYWFRISVTGSSPVVIKFEYSLDGATYTTGYTYNDASNAYTAAGATQIVSGLGSPYTFHYIDDVVYKKVVLGVTSVSIDDKSIVVFKKDNTININSTENTIKSVQLFDVNGRVIATKNNVNASETSFSGQSFASGVIFAKITGMDDKVVTKKLLY
jgi:hypothetical protein